MTIYADIAANRLAPVDATAAEVVSSGVRFDFTPPPGSTDRALPYWTRRGAAVQKIGARYGKLILQGLHSGGETGSDAVYALRCECGTYTLRRGRMLGLRDSCDECAYLLHLRTAGAEGRPCVPHRSVQLMTNKKRMRIRRMEQRVAAKAARREGQESIELTDDVRDAAARCIFILSLLRCYGQAFPTAAERRRQKSGAAGFRVVR